MIDGHAYEYPATKCLNPNKAILGSLSIIPYINITLTQYIGIIIIISILVCIFTSQLMEQITKQKRK